MIIMNTAWRSPAGGLVGSDEAMATFLDYQLLEKMTDTSGVPTK